MQAVCVGNRGYTIQLLTSKLVITDQEWRTAADASWQCSPDCEDRTPTCWTFGCLLGDNAVRRALRQQRAAAATTVAGPCATQLTGEHW
jgi:hypothetical protein